ncbi:siphovirus Gp157 family protein [Candidatus Parcubacteria bacterium]|nr:siphovirus Gp157 family protein [Candidatus Parcubacteria bacterium]
MISNSLSFWEIGAEYQRLLPQLYNPETGEIDEEIDRQISAISETADNKCISVTKWIKHLEAERKQIEFVKQEIAKRESAYDKEIAKQMQYLENNMKRCNIKEIKCPYFTIKLKENPYSTEILDEAVIPEKFMRTKEIVKTEIKPDKNAIKEEVLSTGIQVPGASVERKTKIVISIDNI